MKIKLLHKKAKLPTVQNPGEDIGYDLYAIEDVFLSANQVTKVRTGIAIEFDRMMGGILKDRSSMAAKGVTISGGVIDGGYRGEILVLMTFHRPDVTSRFLHYEIKPGDKIAQLIPQVIYTKDLEVYAVNELDESNRGEKGFGSSGR